MGAHSEGAGIENLGSAIGLQNVTIAANTGSAAIHNIATMSAVNTIVSNGASGNCTGQITSQGHNLESADECDFHSAGDQTGRDPLLGALGDNGGPTDTEALLAGSPAIDTGDPAGCPPADQRGVARPQRLACDIGAFELAPSAPSNAFKFGRLKLNKHKGTATLTVVVPGPGTLTLGGKGIVNRRPGSRARAAASKAVSVAGNVKLLIKAKGKARRKLGRTGKAKVKAKVTYTPTGGAPNTLTKTVKLIKRR
jgi:hypothetical protein